MLKVRQFREIHSESLEGLFDNMIHLVAVVNDLDPMDVQHWKPSDLINEYKKAQKVVNVSERYASDITIEDTTLSLMDFSHLTFGQFIDIEALINEGVYVNIHNIASSIYLHTKRNNLTENEIEEYQNVNIGYRAMLIDELPIQHVFGAVKKYTVFRDNFFKSYELFDDPYADVDVDELDEDELIEYNAHIAEREKQGKNQWETVLNILAQNDITKFKTILNTNLFLCFNQLSYLKRNS